MPGNNFVETSKEAVQALFAEAGNTKKTLNEKKLVVQQFQKWCAEKNIGFEDLLKDDKLLKFSFIEYLESYRVKSKSDGQLIRPKAGYLNKVKSHLKTELTRLSGEK